MVQKKIAQRLRHRHFATVCSIIMQFHQSAEKLTGNTKNGQILNSVIEYSLTDGKGTTLRANVTKLTENLSTPIIIDLVVRLGCSLIY